MKCPKCERDVKLIPFSTQHILLRDGTWLKPEYHLLCAKCIIGIEKD